MKTRRKKRVLIIAPHPPFPLNEGGNVRLWSLCRRLKEHYAFSLLCFINPLQGAKSVDAMALRLKLSEVFDAVEWVPLRNEFDLWFREGFWEVEGNLSLEGFVLRLQNWLRREVFDLVQIEHIQMARFRRYVWGPPVVLTELDLGWIAWKDSLRPDIRQGPLWKRGADWLKRLQEYFRISRTFQGIVTTGYSDDRWWRQWGPADIPVTYVPNGVDVPVVWGRTREPALSRPNLLFVGYYPHPPNSDAAFYFLSEIWPLVLNKLPSVRVTFAGANPPLWLRERGGERVRVTGFVDDLSARMRKSHVMIVPARLGRGSKIKILDALAAGLPVVVTRSALRGYEPSLRDCVCVAGSARGFAKETVNLLKNEALRSRISKAAHQWVAQNRTWEQGAERLDGFYSALLR